MPKTIDWSALSDEYASNTPEIISEVIYPAKEFAVEDLNSIHPDAASGRHGTGRVRAVRRIRKDCERNELGTSS